MDSNIIPSCVVLIIIVAIVFSIARFFFKLTIKIVSIITIIITIGLLAILYFYVL